MGDTMSKRPAGLAIIAILFLLAGLLNIYDFTQNLKELPLELWIGVIIFVLGSAEIFTGYGLWMGKSWSYKLALTLIILSIVVRIAFIVLTLSDSAKLEVQVRNTIFDVIVAFFLFSYLRLPRVKNYLGARR